MSLASWEACFPKWGLEHPQKHVWKLLLQEYAWSIDEDCKPAMNHNTRVSSIIRPAGCLCTPIWPSSWSCFSYPLTADSSYLLGITLSAFPDPLASLRCCPLSPFPLCRIYSAATTVFWPWLPIQFSKCHFLWSPKDPLRYFNFSFNLSLQN